MEITIIDKISQTYTIAIKLKTTSINKLRTSNARVSHGTTKLSPTTVGNSDSISIVGIPSPTTGK